MSLEKIILSSGGSFGLDDDADDDGEDESDDEAAILGISGDKRLGRLTKTHSIQMRCAVTLCENLAEKVGEDGKCGNKDFEDIFAEISGVLVQVITFVDDSNLKKVRHNGNCVAKRQLWRPFSAPQFLMPTIQCPL